MSNIDRYELFSKLEGYLHDRKQETLSELLEKFVEALKQQGYSELNFLESVADYLNKNHSQKTMEAMENLIQVFKGETNRVE